MQSKAKPASRVHDDRRDWKNLKAILPFLWEFRGRAVIALVFLVLAKVANVGIPIFLKKIVDSLNQQPEQLVVLPVALLLAYGALKLSASLFNELRGVIFAKVRYRAMRRLSTRVLNHLHQLSLRFHLERRTGGITRDIERGTRSVSSILNYMAFSILPIIVEFSLVAIVLIKDYDPIFSIAIFGSVIVYIGFTFSISEWRIDFRHQMNALDSKSNSRAIDSLMNYETVKYFNNEDMEVSRYDNTLGEWEDWAVKNQSSMSLLNIGQGAIIALGVTWVMYLATQGVVEGSMSIGDLVLVNAFLLQLFIPLNFLGIVYRQIKYSLADMDLVFKLLEKQPEVIDSTDAPELIVEQGHIRFEDVDFSYQEERKIINNVSFEIKGGEKVAIVGHSGAGKSTLSRLMYRFYDINNGEISIDGQNIAEVTQNSLRRVISIVPQDCVLFNESIYYNLQYGNKDASQEEIHQAAKLAHIYDFINALPEQWDSIVGERGLKLSGGEKQRVAIARALLKKPKILIFDEATSSLDSQTEKSIQQTLQEVAKDHTTMVIAHRLSTIIDADRILVLGKGEVIEQGRHEALLSMGGAYAQMWQLQQEDENTDHTKS